MLLILLSPDYEPSPGAATRSARAVADGRQNIGPVADYER